MIAYLYHLIRLFTRITRIRIVFAPSFDFARPQKNFDNTTNQILSIKKKDMFTINDI